MQLLETAFSKIRLPDWEMVGGDIVLTGYGSRHHD
jgi:hypothetical protein